MEAVPPENTLEVRTYFVRDRNALVARAEFSDLYVDYYLHQGQHGYRHDPHHDQMLKEALAAMVLHSAARPMNEVSAWTIHFQQPLLNLFVTGDNQLRSVVGQIFTENVKQMELSRFVSDVVRGHSQPRRSVVEFDGNDVFRAVELYYEKSEQLPARIFQHAEEDFVIVCAHPDCDMEWFAALDNESIKRLDQDQTLRLLEKRYYNWSCGCNQQRMLAVLAPLMRQDADGLFGDEVALRMSCPRCGARYKITREVLEAYVASENAGRK